jgi:hypothetical protein
MLVMGRRAFGSKARFQGSPFQLLPAHRTGRKRSCNHLLATLVSKRNLNGCEFMQGSFCDSEHQRDIDDLLHPRPRHLSIGERRPRGVPTSHESKRRILVPMSMTIGWVRFILQKGLPKSTAPGSRTRSPGGNMHPQRRAFRHMAYPIEAV